MARLRVAWREDAATLKRWYRQEKDHQKRTRLLALWHLRQGRTIREAAEWVGVHPRTVQKWVVWYRQGGVEEVLRHRHGGQRPHPVRLTEEQQAELKALAEAGEIRTIWDGVRWAQEKWKVAYTYWGMRWVFRRLGLRKKVPRPRHAQASVAEQEAWKKGG